MKFSIFCYWLLTSQVRPQAQLTAVSAAPTCDTSSGSMPEVGCFAPQDAILHDGNEPGSRAAAFPTWAAVQRTTPANNQYLERLHHRSPPSHPHGACVGMLSESGSATPGFLALSSALRALAISSSAGGAWMTQPAMHSLAMPTGLRQLDNAPCVVIP